MKLRWNIIMLGLLMASCSRQIGTYCTGPNYTAYCYELRKGGKFSFEESTCTGGSQGIGDYKIIGDTIKFQFKKRQEVKRGRYELHKVQELDKKIIVNLMVVDSQSRESIMGYSAFMYSDDVRIGGEAGDLEGKASLKTAFNQKPIRLVITSTAMHSVNFEIKDDGAYNVLVELADAWFQPISPQLRIYKLVKLNNKNLVIGGFGEKEWTTTLFRYEKKEKRKRKKK